MAQEMKGVEDRYGTVVLDSLTQFAHHILLLWHALLEGVKKSMAFKRSPLNPHPGNVDGDEGGKSLKEMPGPFPLPFFGTTLSRSVGTSDLHASNQLLFGEYGNVVKLEHYWNYPLVILYDGDDIETVLKSASTHRPEMEIVSRHRKTRPDRYSSVGIVNSQGEDWRKFRSSIGLLHHHSYVLSYVRSCDEIMTDFIQVLRTLSTTRIENFDDLILRLTFENSSKFILNKRMNFLDRGVSQKMDVFIHATHQYFQALQVSMYGFPSWKYFPSKVWNEFVKYENEMYDIFAEVVQEEVKNGTVDGILKSILEAEQISTNDRSTLVRDLVLAAMEPVQNSTLIALHWICRNGEVESKLFRELTEVLPRKDSVFDEGCLQSVPYLKACIQESFRISPTTPNLARFMESQIQIQNYNIPPYTLIVCQHWFACLQDSNFYRAKEFIPERWLPRDEPNPDPNHSAYLPHRPKLLYHFGFGRRECPGRRFAFQEICITVAKLLRNFQIHFPNELNLNYFFLQQPSFPVPIEMRERTQ